jgi:hypothetical protein
VQTPLARLDRIGRVEGNSRRVELVAGIQRRQQPQSAIVGLTSRLLERERRLPTATLIARDHCRIAEAEALAAAGREMIEQGGVLPFSEGADM